MIEIPIVLALVLAAVVGAGAAAVHFYISKAAAREAVSDELDARGLGRKKKTP